jgi:predicted DCC family thiol-disulfide oxidoreductase YuxK
MSSPGHPVILFDGVCNLCNAFVNFVLDRDPTAQFHFASLQSPGAAALLAERGLPAPAAEPDSIVLIDGDRVYERSTAALRIARRLRGPIRVLSVFMVVPRPLRDLVYRFVARYRYRWFGRRDMCRVPTPELRARFLD